MAITDHVPIRGGCLPPERGPRPPLDFHGVLRVPGLEYSGSGGHLLILGADPEDAPRPEAIPGWPEAAACARELAERTEAVTFVAHPDDRGNPFLNLVGYEWRDWEGAATVTGMEIWNLGTDWSRSIRSYGDIVRALWNGLYRAVPAPNPRTLARWDELARRRPVVGIAGTDAHAYRVRWRGLRLVVLPYRSAFSSLQTGVWVPAGASGRPAAERARLVVDALRHGRALMVNRAWGHPLGFVFQARATAGSGPGGVYISGDTIPPGVAVRFEVTVPTPAWLRLVRNGRVVANTFGRDLSFEPLADSESDGPTTGREAWRAEAWIPCSGLTRGASRVHPWILSNFIYRGEEVSLDSRRR